jgi:hypothetical protein
MKDSGRDQVDPEGGSERQRRTYDPPAIVWREPYRPTVSGISCARQTGNPQCEPGPLTT